MKKRHKKIAKRIFYGGLWWCCQRPGLWVDEGNRFGLYHMLAGTAQAMWEVHVRSKENEFLDMIGSGPTMGEAIDDACQTCMSEVRQAKIQGQPSGQE